jgi:Amidase
VTNLGAYGLVRLLRGGAVSAREVTAAYVARSEEINPLINAIVAPRFAEAFAEASRLDRAFARGRATGRLHGLPITVKECIAVHGMVATGGVVGGAATRADRDAAVIRLLRKEGAIVLGKTNLAQLCWGHETDNPLFGRANNPWNLALTPGRSSGGEAAIAAAGGSALGVGTDSGGSVRVPAHYCGIHALKPTSGRLPAAGSHDTRLLAFQAIVANQPGLLGRRAKDIALVYDVLTSGRVLPDGAGHVPAGTEDGADLTGWRIGYYLDLGASRAAPAVADAVMQSLRALTGLGADAEQFTPPDLGSSPRSREVDDALRRTGRPCPGTGCGSSRLPAANIVTNSIRPFVKCESALSCAPRQPGPHRRMVWGRACRSARPPSITCWGCPRGWSLCRGWQFPPEYRSPGPGGGRMWCCGPWQRWSSPPLARRSRMRPGRSRPGEVQPARDRASLEYPGQPAGLRSEVTPVGGLDRGEDRPDASDQVCEGRGRSAAGDEQSLAGDERQDRQGTVEGFGGQPLSLMSEGGGRGEVVLGSATTAGMSAGAAAARAVST